VSLCTPHPKDILFTRAKSNSESGNQVLPSFRMRSVAPGRSGTAPLPRQTDSTANSARPRPARRREGEGRDASLAGRGEEQGGKIVARRGHLSR
jgi:hypothetical protein